MSIWFVIWFLLSSALLGFVVWTTYLLYSQKKAWRLYAKKNKLRYSSKQMMSFPEMSGLIDGYTVSFFTGEHMGEDARRARRLNAIEIQPSSCLPVDAGVASGGMVEFIKDLGIVEEIHPENPRWKRDSYIAVADNRSVLSEYLTQDRLEALLDLMTVKNAWVVLVFRGDMALLRLDTPDPLDSEAKLNEIVQKMLKAVRLLEIDEGEAKRLKAQKARRPASQKAIDVKDEDMMVSGLELEEDDEGEDGHDDRDESDRGGESDSRQEKKSSSADEPDQG